MNILIDTQILIWSLDINSSISEYYLNLLEDTSNEIFVSQISLMELSIKKNLNKLPQFVPDIQTVTTQLINNGFNILSLKNEHIFNYQNLPLFAEHRDPFDRFIIATAQSEHLPIITTDTKFQLYATIINLL